MTAVSIFGYFAGPHSPKPDYDPGMDVTCPFCLRPLSTPVKTVSLMAPKSDRSFFYRSHKRCYEAAEPKDICDVESSVIDG